MSTGDLNAYKGFLETQIRFTDRLIKQKIAERDGYLKEIAVTNYQINKLNHE